MNCCKKTIGFGIAIWVLMFAIVSALVAFGLYDTRWMKIVIIAIVAIITFIFSGYAKPAKISSALTYGISWVAVGLVLDFLVTKRFNLLIFSSRSLWVGYAMVLLVPMIRIKKSTPPNIQ